MRLIPGKTKVKIELFRGVTIGDIIVGGIAMGLITLVLLSTFPGRIYIISAILVITILLVIRLDSQPNYMVLLGLLRFLAYPRAYTRKESDADLLAKRLAQEDALPSEDETEAQSDARVRASIEQIITDKKRKQQDERLENGEQLTAAEQNERYQQEQAEEAVKAKIEAAPKKNQHKKKDKKIEPMEELCPFTGFSDGFIEYGGKYYGSVIEITPIEFRFFSQYRRDASIEQCLGKILRGLRAEYAANIIKI